MASASTPKLLCEQQCKREATKKCTKCEVLFCDECDLKIHVVALSAHIRVPFVVCPVHNSPAGHYCTQDGRLACPSCLLPAPQGTCSTHAASVKLLAEAATTAREKLATLRATVASDKQEILAEGTALGNLQMAIVERLGHLKNAYDRADPALAKIDEATALPDSRISDMASLLIDVEKQRKIIVASKTAWQAQWEKLVSEADVCFEPSASTRKRSGSEEVKSASKKKSVSKTTSDAPDAGAADPVLAAAVAAAKAPVPLRITSSTSAKPAARLAPKAESFSFLPTATTKMPNLAALTSHAVSGVTLKNPGNISLVADGSVLVSDSSREGKTVQVWLNGEQAARELPEFANRASMALPIPDDPSGLVVLVSGLGRIERTGSTAWRKTGFSKPYAAVISGDALFFTESGAARVVQLNLRTGDLVGDFKTEALKVPKGIAVSPAREIVVADEESKKVFVFNLKNRKLLHTLGEDALKEPQAVCVDDHGRIFVADHHHTSKSIVVLDGPDETRIPLEAKPVGMILTPDGKIVVSLELSKKASEDGAPTLIVVS